MPAMFYFAYYIGVLLLGGDTPGADFEFNLESILSSLGDIGAPFLLGCLVLGIVSSLLGYFGISLYWRYNVSKQWRNRKR